MGGGPEAVQGGLKATFGLQEQIRLESAGGTVQGFIAGRDRLGLASFGSGGIGVHQAVVHGVNKRWCHRWAQYAFVARGIPPTGAKATLQEGSDRRSERQVRRAASLASWLRSWPGSPPPGGSHACPPKPSTPPTPRAGAVAFGELAGHGRVLLPQKAATLARETR